MTHVVVGIGDSSIRALVHEALEDQGHSVTVAKDFWQALGVLRSALHPLVVVYLYDASVGDVVHDAAQVQALVAHFDELKRHAYVQISWWRRPLPSPLQPLAEQVLVEMLPGPFGLEDLLAAVNHALTRLADRDA